MRITKELTFYSIKKKNNYFLLFLSIAQGWGITKIRSKVSFDNSFKSIFFSETYSCFFSNLFLGFFRNYFYFLKVKGMGFKMIGHIFGIIVKLGYSHRVLYSRQKELAFTYLNRHLLKIEGRSLSLIKTSLFQFIQLKKKSIYKKKGIFLKGSVLKIKLTSKKSKF
jgi:ribosomal protein L6P/L9E